MPGLNVLHVTQPTEAGVAQAVRDISADQSRRGWRATVASPVDGDLRTWVTEDGVAHADWPARRNPGPDVIHEARSLQAIVRSVDPDLVHLHSSKAGLVGRLVLRGRRPTLFQPHAWSFAALTGRARSGAIAWERFAARWADVILCVSQEERQLGESMGVAGPLSVLPNGVDLSRFHPADEQDRRQARSRLLLDDVPTVVCIGRLSRQKGQDVLLAAWPRVTAVVPNARLVLVGEGPARGDLEVAAAAGVLFAGSTRDVYPWLAAADVVALPSRWEGLAFALLEALAAARSVVTTDVSGAGELVGDGAGAVVPAEDPAALANAITGRLRRPTLAAEEGREGRRRIERHHDVRQQLDDIAALTLVVARRQSALSAS